MNESLIKKDGLIIAGPCSAESEEQLVTTAKRLAKTGMVDVLRAGIWKPRTNPGGFEGVGLKGLSWLSTAKEETGLPVGTEVATSRHVEDALHYDVDVLWIGARTSVNPFSVQNIADALKGTDSTVLIKNPVNPDLKLWIGAVERIRNAGITNIGLIHRGFSSYGNKEYRNAPIWQIPIEMMRIFPDLPMICDPSHIAGKRDTLHSVSQKSLDLHYNGLIIESHYKPEEALTDKEQQVSPDQLSNLLNQLVWKKESINLPEYQQKIESLRDQINQFDDELIHLLQSRMIVAENIGQLKKINNVTVLQSNRWNEILEKMISKTRNTKLSEDFVKSMMELLHVESIRIQNDISNR
jgi:chorismate mutase